MMSLIKWLAVFEIPKNSVSIPKVAADQSQLNNIMNGAFTIAGAIAVLFIIIGAFRYVTSQGDASAVKTAREMIIYSLVGLVFVAFAFLVVQIVIYVVSQ